MSDLIEKISKLLAHAEGTSSQEEAETYIQQAQMLASRYSIDLAVARQRIAKRENRENPEVRNHKFDQTIAKRNQKKALVELYSAIAGQNDVKINIYHDSSGIIAFGMPSDIEVVDALFARLAVHMITESNKYLKSGAYKSETYWDDYSWSHKPVDGRVARRSFMDGYVQRIRGRLRDARRAAMAEAQSLSVTVLDDDDNVVESSAELVLVAKQDEVAAFYKQNSTARGSWKGSSGRHSSAASHSAGSEAGSRARLGAQGELGGSRRALA